MLIIDEIFQVVEFVSFCKYGSSSSIFQDYSKVTNVIKNTFGWAMVVISVAILCSKWCPSFTSIPAPVLKIKEQKWRNYVDPDRKLSHELRSNILASLKPLSPLAIKENTVATLLILSSNEEKAAEVARCLLPIVNGIDKRNEVCLFLPIVLQIIHVLL